MNSSDTEDGMPTPDDSAGVARGSAGSPGQVQVGGGVPEEAAAPDGGDDRGGSTLEEIPDALEESPEE